MKTLTEFSTLTLRKAAEIRARIGPVAAPAPAPVPEPEPAPAAPAAKGEEPAEAAAPAEDAPKPEPQAEDAKPDPVVDAIASELHLQPDRAARLIEALDIVGDRIEQVRLVRVFQGETAPHGAVSRGEFHYAVDRVAGPPKRRGRDDREGRGGDRGGRGGRGGGPGGGDRRDKPRGLGSLKVGAHKDEPRQDDRPGRGEMPRAGIGWQLTAAPRDMEGRGGPRGGPRGDRRDRRGRGPGGPGGPRGPRGPGGPGGSGGSGGPGGERREGRGEGRRDRGPRRDQRLGPPPAQQPTQPPVEAAEGQAAPEPHAAPGGPEGAGGRRKRPRKPIGPDANGLGPDGTPWDPERRAKRQAERVATPPQPVNTPEAAPVEASTPPPGPDAPEAPQNSDQ